MATITKRGNAYLIRVSCGYDANGKQIVFSKTWKPEREYTPKQEQKELQRIALLFEEKCLSGQYLDGSTKFCDFSQTWLREYAQKQLRTTTIATYEKMISNLNGIIGHLQLDKIQPQHLMQCYDKLKGIEKENSFAPCIDFEIYISSNYKSKAEFARACGVSKQVISAICTENSISKASAEKICVEIRKPLKTAFKSAKSKNALSGKTVLNYHRLISSILETAVKWQILLSNPCRRVDAPKAERKEARYLDEKQAMQILQALENEPLKYRALFTLLLYSGMRRGEICGLCWRDIDFQTGVIDINKSSLYVSGKGVFDDETKNTSSMRSIKVPSFVLDLLQELRKEQLQEMFKQGSAWQGSFTNEEKIFTQANGKPIHPCSVTDWFEKFVKRHDLPSVCVHSLRHTNATLMIASGVDLRTVSKRLGHAQMTTTANIYTHAIRTADEIASNTIENILNIKKA